MAAKTAREIIKTVGDFTNEILDLAEERELTIQEVLLLPDIIKNKAMYELQEREIPYKREKPTAEAAGKDEIKGMTINITD